MLTILIFTNFYGDYQLNKFGSKANSMVNKMLTAHARYLIMDMNVETDSYLVTTSSGNELEAMIKKWQ